eukprot:2076489-Rhodomonas_salina.3
MIDLYPRHATSTLHRCLLLAVRRVGPLAAWTLHLVVPLAVPERAKEVEEQEVGKHSLDLAQLGRRVLQRICGRAVVADHQPE